MPGARSEGSLTAEERRTTRYLHGFVGEILGLLATHFGGNTTLNHLRIGSYVGFRSLYDGSFTNNKDIAETLGIPRPTVTRIVNDFLDQGWVLERPHPEDGRRRRLLVSRDHPLADAFERDFRRLLHDLLRRYASGELVEVDPDKKSF